MSANSWESSCAANIRAVMPDCSWWLGSEWGRSILTALIWQWETAAWRGERPDVGWDWRGSAPWSRRRGMLEWSLLEAASAKRALKRASFGLGLSAGGVGVVMPGLGWGMGRWGLSGNCVWERLGSGAAQKNEAIGLIFYRCSVGKRSDAGWVC